MHQVYDILQLAINLIALSENAASFNRLIKDVKIDVSLKKDNKVGII